LASNTPNLGLLKKDPMTDGNETFNIETMLNENWDKIDTAVGQVREGLENVNVDIPDASLTEKGIVQLSSATNGTRENVAATEKAVKAAYDRGSAAEAAALPKTIPDTRSVATKPSDYNQNVAYSFKSGSVVGLANEEYVVIHGFKGWNDDSGGLSHEYASGGTTGKLYHRTGTSSNNTWGPWVQIIDYGEAWQKAKITEDNNKSILISGQDLNTIVRNGFYNGDRLINGPLPAQEGLWYYLEVQCHSNGDSYVLQRAMRLNGGVQTLYQRTRENGVWQPWSQDLFTSVANGKQAIASAISGKGVPALGSDEFAVLANKISQIKTDAKVSTGSFSQTSYSAVTIANLPFKPYAVFVYGSASTTYDGNYAAGAQGWTGAYLNGSEVVVTATVLARLYGGIQQSDYYRLKDVAFGSNSVSFAGDRGFVGPWPYIVFGV